MSGESGACRRCQFLCVALQAEGPAEVGLDPSSAWMPWSVCKPIELKSAAAGSMLSSDVSP